MKTKTTILQLVGRAIFRGAALSLVISNVSAQTPIDASDGIEFGTGTADPAMEKDPISGDLNIETPNGVLKLFGPDDNDPDFKAGEGHSGTVTSGKWYRIARLVGAKKRANALFTLRDSINMGGHSTVNFRAGISYADSGRMGVTLLSHTSYLRTTFTDIRILRAGTTSQSYLEVKVARSGAVNFSIYDNLANSGWTPVNWVETISIPSGYSVHTYDIDKVFAVGGSQNFFSIARSGSVGFGSESGGNFPLEIAADGSLHSQGNLSVAGNFSIGEQGSNGYLLETLSNGTLISLGNPLITSGNATSLLADQFVPTNSGGSLLLEGTFGGSGAIPTQGPGTRMMWYPEKSAFRVGTVDSGGSSTSWNDVNIGDYSVAMGLNTTASGSASVALGRSDAYGSYSTASGRSDAYGDYSTAMGDANAYGLKSTAFGEGEARANYSTAFGLSDARGFYSTAMGHKTDSSAFASLSVGQYNVDIYDQSDPATPGKAQWMNNSLHSVFEVGIGLSNSDRKNALTILQDGSVEVGKATTDTTNPDHIPLIVTADGTIIIGKPQGDISMGVYN